MTKNTRRSFFKMALSAVALAPVLKVANILAAAPEKMIDAKKTKMLKYVADAAEAKKLHAAGDKNYKKYKDGSNCAGCKFYTADAAYEGYGKCTMAAKQYVDAKGWCKSYMAKKK